MSMLHQTCLSKFKRKSTKWKINLKFLDNFLLKS